MSRNELVLTKARGISTAKAAGAASGSLLEHGGVDAERIRPILANATRGADDGELYVERTESEQLSFDDGKLRFAHRTCEQGFGLRVVAGEAVGYAHSTELSEASIRRASCTASQARSGHSGSSSVGDSTVPVAMYGTGDPNNEPAFATKVELLQVIDRYARELDPSVAQVSAWVETEQKCVEILRVDRELMRDARPLVSIGVSITVARGEHRESASMACGGRESLVRWITPHAWKPIVDECFREASVLLDAGPCPAGVMDVVIGPGWNGVLLHEAVGHGLEGDFNWKGSSVFAGRVGEQVAARGVTVFDNGSVPWRRGSLMMDDEGTATQNTPLIEDGRLVGYMHDRQSARLMSRKSTGNGRRQSFAHIPMPRMTNTCMAGGTSSREEMIASTARGLYCAKLGGGQVDITSGKFVFACLEAYVIENGKLGRPVKGATLIGDGATALKGVQMVGSDFDLDPGIGSCGKAGQTVPVGVGQPSIKIRGLTVGGTDLA